MLKAARWYAASKTFLLFWLFVCAAARHKREKRIRSIASNKLSRQTRFANKTSTLTGAIPDGRLCRDGGRINNQDNCMGQDVCLNLVC